MKITYLFFLTPGTQMLSGIGVINKIKTQVEVFNKNFDECDFISVPQNKTGTLGILINYLLNGFLGMYNLKNFAFKNTDVIYFRKPYLLLPKMISFFKKYKKLNPNGKVIMEIPTYPYESEFIGIKGKILLYYDRKYRNKLSKYLDRIATYSSDDEIFGKKTIKIINGIDCSKIKIKSRKSCESLNLLMVAQFSKWHAVDRLLEGLKLYDGKKSVILHLVGNGRVIEDAKNYVKQHMLEDQVIFYGSLFGDELDSVYQKCDIGVCSLGNHRHNIFLSSELKSREYLAKGLPIVASTKIDVIEEDWPYCLYVPEDDSPVNIQNIVNFVDKVYKIKPRQEVIYDIRKYAEQNCDISKTMKPVIDYIKME